MFFQTNNKIGGPTWDLVADFHQVFQYDFMTNAFIAGTVVAILAGVVGYFVVLRRLAFACEALSHGGFAGATGAVVLGQDVFLGLLVFTSVTGGFMGLLVDRIGGRDVAIGGTLAFSLALGSLFLTISTRFAGQAVNILFGNVLAISSSDLVFVAVFAVLALVMVGAMYRPLLFSSVDAEIADARGVPVRFLSVAFMVLLAVTVSASVPVVGVLLIRARLSDGRPRRPALHFSEVTHVPCTSRRGAHSGRHWPRRQRQRLAACRRTARRPCKPTDRQSNHPLRLRAEPRNASDG